MTLVLLMADGARPDTLGAAIDAGHLPAIARLRAGGSSHVVTTVFPSVTGPAYLPFLTGRHPGDAGIPGIRWWDRSGRVVRTPGRARSYVGIDAMRADRDLDPAHATLFERTDRALAALSPFNRGLTAAQRLDGSLGFWLRLAWHHFRGDLPGWLRLERTFATRFTERVRRDRPEVAFLALPGIDKCSHPLGHAHPAVLDAMRVVDETVGRLTADAERDGRADALEIWIISDHGHAPVDHHDDLADALRELGLGVRAHPWLLAGGDDVAVMVGGNGMAHLYCDLGRRDRPWWGALAPRWEATVTALLARPAVDLIALPLDPTRCEVRARGRGRAEVTRTADGRYRYTPLTGDPLGLAPTLGDGGRALDADEAHEATIASAYPDALVQLATLAGSARAGDLLISASPRWDLRARYEPTPHRSSHGALHREHMLVPLLLSRPAIGTPRRTVDVYPSALRRLGRDLPDGLPGHAFR